MLKLHDIIIFSISYIHVEQKIDEIIIVNSSKKNER